jgi:hypothetical protein
MLQVPGIPPPPPQQGCPLPPQVWQVAPPPIPPKVHPRPELHIPPTQHA